MQFSKCAVQQFSARKQRQRNAKCAIFSHSSWRLALLMVAYAAHKHAGSFPKRRGSAGTCSGQQYCYCYACLGAQLSVIASALIFKCLHCACSPVGTYEHSGAYSKLHKGPGFSIRGKLDINNKTPSPGAIYELPSNKSLSYSFGRRISSNSDRGLPGPGQYELSSSTLGYATWR